MVKRRSINFRIFSDFSLPCAAMWCAVVIFVCICILFPLGCVLLTPRLSDFLSFFKSRASFEIMRNTALTCVCSTTLSVFTGFVYAFAVVRGEIPFAKFFAAIPILHLVTPPFVGGLSFILLFGRQGFITHTILNLDVSFYGFFGLLLSQTLCFFPVAYLICAETLRGISSNAEQAAFGLGASGVRIFWTITLPLSASGLISAALFIAVSVLSDFGNPIIVAGRFRVLAVEIYTQLTGWLNAGTSAVLGLVLVFPSIVLFLLQNRLSKKNVLKIATVGAKSSNIPPKRRSIFSRIFLTVFCAVVSIAVLAQFVSICLGAFQKLWGINTAFTTEHIRAVFRYGIELRNTAIFSFVSALFSTLIAFFAAFLVNRTKMPLKSAIDSFVQLPAAVPGSLFGLAFSLASNKTGFRSSAVLIIIAITVGFLPFSYRILCTALSKIKTTLDDGAESLGAGKMRLLYEILAPLCAGELFSAFLYDFVRGVGTMSAVIFLVSFGTPLASVKILNLADEGFWGKAAALALVLTILTFGVLALGSIALKIKKKGIKNEKSASVY